MPIRFRCSHCSRLLGIATRKAGTTTRCPQCGNSLVVPIRSEDEDDTHSDGLDPIPPPNEATERSLPAAPPAPKPKPKPRPPGDEPLFIGDDIDDLLGLPKKPLPVATPPAGGGGRKPVSGMDAMSLNEEPPRTLVITPRKATLVVVGVVVLMLLSLAVGFLLGMNTTRG